MSYLRNFIARLAKDEDGAALVEYSILIGLITVVVIAAVVFVGGWVEDQWAALQTGLTGQGAT